MKWMPYQEEIKKIRKKKKRKIQEVLFEDNITKEQAHAAVMAVMRKRKNNNSERTRVHLPLMKWARQHPICNQYLIHIANERRCSLQQGAILKAMGVKRGVSDLFLAYPTKRYAGFWLELKAPGKKPTESQLEWFSRMEKVGFCCAWFDDWDKAKNSILEYLS